MTEKRCDVGLGPHEIQGYRLYVKGDCGKVLEDIKKHLGEYGQRYFESRLVFENNGIPSSQSAATEIPDTKPSNELKSADP